MRTMSYMENTGPVRGRRREGSESGSALLIVTMITVILTLLGLSYLAVADQENTIAINQRNADQLTFVSEAGAKMVKAWFDRPVEGDPNNPIFKFMGDYDIRKTLYYDRTQRIFDHDNDPNTADVLADGTTGKPYYRQGLTLTADPNYLSFWDKPYRGSLAAEFKGSEAGPDIVIQANNTSVDWMDILNQRVVSPNKTVQESVGRIQRIDVYAPPIIDVGGVKTRFGIATVKITATKFKYLGKVGIVPVTNNGSVEVARQVSKMVINEVPYPGPTGPFNTCTAFDINGNIQIHWGEIVAGVNAAVGPASQLVNRTKRTVPFASVSRYLGPPNLANWITANNGTTNADFDPWFKLRAGGTITGAPDPNSIQVYPYVPITTVANDTTAIFQNSPSTCPAFEYQIWKNVALSGGQNIHYMVYSATNSYKEDGLGTAQDLKAWTNGKEGFWFFDTTDRLPPNATGSNIGGAMGLSGTWNSAGFIYMNSDWDSTGTGGGVNRVLIPPGEPWVDADADGVADPGEYVNLKYPTSLSGGFRPYTDGHASNPAQTASVTSTNGITYSYTTKPSARDTQGIPFTDTIHFQGVLYVEGEFQFNGNLNVFGAVVTKGGMTSTSAGTPDIYFDERLIKGDWPPPELELPRTMVTFWETDL